MRSAVQLGISASSLVGLMTMGSGTVIGAIISMLLLILNLIVLEILS